MSHFDAKMGSSDDARVLELQHYSGVNEAGDGSEDYRKRRDAARDVESKCFDPAGDQNMLPAWDPKKCTCKVIDETYIDNHCSYCTSYYGAEGGDDAE